LAIRAGLLQYKGTCVHSVEDWADELAKGAYRGYAELDELARYSLIAGYVAWLAPHPTILDVGCGTGIMRGRLGAVPFSRYVGVDYAPAVLDEARRLEDERTSFILGGPDQAQPHQFDIAIANEVLYETPEPRAFVEEICRRLVPGGYLVSSNFRHTGDSGLHRILDARLELIDAVDAKNLTSRVPRQRRWRVTCHRLPA
jgi:2-polyprenyl-6-hydroxyphenyl methylase/3-demethylubiquinone-9 3-methyltransferase